MNKHYSTSAVRAALLALALPLLGCGDDDASGPEGATLQGTWDMVQVNDQSLPAEFEGDCSDPNESTDLYVVSGGELRFTSETAGRFIFNATQAWCDGELEDDSDDFPITAARTGDTVTLSDEGFTFATGTLNGDRIRFIFSDDDDIQTITFEKR